MNKTRRKWLADVISQLEEKRDELWNIYEDEEMAYDNLPESLQESERGITMQDNMGTIEDAYNDLDNLIESLNELI